MQPEKYVRIDKSRDAYMASYFQTARHWYSAVYHHPIAGRSLYAVIALFALATLFLTALVWNSVLPIDRQRALMVSSNDVFGEISKAYKMARPGDDLNNAIVKHIVPIYVMAREYYEYDREKLEERFSIVHQQSSDKVFAEYHKMMDPKNKASPLVRYDKNIKREVKIESYSINTKQSPYSARVKFRTSVNDGRRIHKNRYVADITFRFSRIQVDQDTGDVVKEDIVNGDSVALGGKLDFKVTEYRVKEVMESE